MVKFYKHALYYISTHTNLIIKGATCASLLYLNPKVGLFYGSIAALCYSAKHVKEFHIKRYIKKGK